MATPSNEGTDLFPKEQVVIEERKKKASLISKISGFLSYHVTNPFHTHSCHGVICNDTQPSRSWHHTPPELLAK